MSSVQEILAVRRFYFGRTFWECSLRDALPIFFLLLIGAALLAYGVWAVLTGNAHSELNS